MSNTKPRVAIIGYPNVGKSTLFNRITGTRDAVVAPESGVTRDRKEGEAEWIGREFIVVDTGGIDIESDAPLGDEVRLQAHLALDEAAVVIFLVDGKMGLAPQDHEIAAILRRSDIPVILAVNKADVKASAGQPAGVLAAGHRRAHGHLGGARSGSGRRSGRGGQTPPRG